MSVDRSRLSRPDGDPVEVVLPDGLASSIGCGSGYTEGSSTSQGRGSSAGTAILRDPSLLAIASAIARCAADPAASIERLQVAQRDLELALDRLVDESIVRSAEAFLADERDPTPLPAADRIDFPAACASAIAEADAIIARRMARRRKPQPARPSNPATDEVVTSYLAGIDLLGARKTTLDQVQEDLNRPELDDVVRGSWTTTWRDQLEDGRTVSTIEVRTALKTYAETLVFPGGPGRELHSRRCGIAEASAQHAQVLRECRAGEHTGRGAR
jgi:hypothetical protein